MLNAIASLFAVSLLSIGTGLQSNVCEGGSCSKGSQAVCCCGTAEQCKACCGEGKCPGADCCKDKKCSGGKCCK